MELYMRLQEQVFKLNNLIAPLIHEAKRKNEGPDYYQRGNIEVWDFIRDQSLNYHLGNVIKYICRAGYKDNDLKDLKKLPIIY